MNEIILNSEDSIWAANKFIDYYSQFDSISEYQKFTSLEKNKNENSVATLFSPEEDFFDEWEMSPWEMAFQLNEVGKDKKYKSKDFSEKLNLVSSHSNEKNIPGKRLQYIITETTTNKVIGFIHLASPIISIKPRHDFLGGVPNMHQVNKHIIMGNVIVPVQPFGYNYLGGKLLAAICCSHEIRENVISKYPKSEIVCFETTSLYGSTKGVSMYDGMKPILRHHGDTVSNMTPNLHESYFSELDHWFAKFNDGEPLVPMKTPRPGNPNSPTTSRKLRCQDKMKAIIRKSLKKHNLMNKLKEFDDSINHASSLTERKRYYNCNYGFQNIKNVILYGEKPIKNKDSWDRYYLDNLIKWWRRKSQNRWLKLKDLNLLRNELEIWNNDSNIDIIR